MTEQPVTALSTEPTTEAGRRLDAAMMGDIAREDWLRRIVDIEREAVADLRASLVAGLDVAALAEVLKEYDAGRIEVAADPGRAVPPGGKPTRFHRRWAEALAVEYARLIEEATK